MIKVLKFLSLLLFPLFGLKAEIHLDQFPEKESSQKMFAVIYQGYLKPGKENEYQDTWNILSVVHNQANTKQPKIPLF